MAKPAGYYSPEAIQSRQQKARDEWEQTYNQPKSEEKKPLEVSIQPTEAQSLVNQLMPNYKDNNADIENLKPVPYLAYNNTSHGFAYYGTGFTGFARKVWADLTDPKKFQQDLSILDDDDQDAVLGAYQNRLDSWEKIIEQKTKWSAWGEKIFGLSAKEVAALPAGLGTEKEITEGVSEVKGDSEAEAKLREAGTLLARGVRLGVDTTQNAIWGGLEILSLADKGVRKIISATQGLDAVADQFDKDDPKNIFEKLVSTGSIAVGKDVFTVASAVSQGKITWADAKESIQDFQKGSEMAYTMVFDEAMRAEFEKGIAEGKDPGLLAQDLGRIGIELAGSILGDPTTYLGVGIVKPSLAKGTPMKLFGKNITLFGVQQKLPWETVGRIPTFGEILNLNVGARKLAQGANRFANNNLPELDGLLEKAGDITNERVAAEVIKEAVTKTAQKFDDLRKHKKYMSSLATVDRDGKVRRMSSDADFFIKNLMGNAGLDETIMTLRDMANLRKGGSKAIEAAKNLLPKKDYVYSDVGMMVGEVLSRLDDGKMFEAIKSSTNHIETHNVIYRKLESVIGDLIPSTDEMLEAAAKLKKGEKITAKEKELAEMAKEIPAVVRTINRITRPAEKISKKTTGGMVQLFMNFVPRAWARNIYGQGVMLAMQQGMWSALDISIEAFVKSPVKKYSDDVIKMANDSIVRKLGFSPIEATKGIGDVLDAGKKTKYGFLPAMQRSEQITASRIIEKTVTDELQKAIPSVLKNMDEWDGLMSILPTEQQSLMNVALQRASGNLDDALDIFRNATKNGEIDAWRLTEPSKDMRNHLTSLGMMDEFYEMQRAAESADDFKAFIQKFAEKYDGFVTKNGQKLPSTLTKMPEELYKFGEDLANNADPADLNLHAELIQSWQNTIDTLRETVNKTFSTADQIAFMAAQQQNPNAPAFFEAVQVAKQKVEQAHKLPSESYRAINALRDQVQVLKEQIKTADKAELLRLWDKKYDYKGGFFKLSDIYTEQDLSKLTPEIFRQRMWTAFFETSANVYRTGNNQYYAKSLEVIDEMAKALGTTIDNIAVAEKGGDNPYRVLSMMQKQAEDIESAIAWKRLLRQFDFAEMPKKPDGTSILLQDVVGDFKKVFDKWEGGRSHIVNSVRKDTGKALKYEDITLEQAWKAIQRRKRIPPDDGTMSMERVLVETKEAFLADVNKWADKVTSEWGVKVPSSSIDFSEQLKKFRPAYESRMQSVRTMAGRVAVEARDFVLHDYDKTYMDHALTYLLGNSFHYWTTRTYGKMAQNLVDSPKTANAYLAYKEYITKEHAGMPDFYRQNVVVNSLLGMDLGNPYYLNLESMVNPVYGLTGVDFNDPRKRVDWLSRTVDDMNKLGPSFSPLVSWSVALHLYNTGYDGAAERWLGRMLPQSQLIKSASSLTGNTIEVDPFVQLTNGEFLGGVDSYERNRVIASMASMVQSGQITQEQMIEASRAESGEIWDAAIQASAMKRWDGDMMSFFVGVGARPRTQDDLVIEKFWGDYSALLSSRSLMSADDYREAWENLREHPEYGAFVDGLLLGRKTGAEQETAYAFNVLSRIPPGQMNDTASLVGISPDMIRKFYDAKGDLSKINMTEQDKKRFFSGIEDMGLLLSMPDNATREDWGDARALYGDMKDIITERYGDDVYDLINEYYSLDSGLKEDFLDDNPLVRDALIVQDYMVLNQPVLGKYYGGFDTTQRYYYSLMDKELSKKYGSEVIKQKEEYYGLPTTQERKDFEKQNPLFKQYLDERKEYMGGLDEALLRVQKYLPPRPKIREDAQPFGESQEALAQYAMAQQLPLEYWQQTIGTSMVRHLSDYASGEVDDISYYADKKLDYEAKKMGISKEELLAMILNSMENR
jgi:hypothetical protein